MDALTTRKKVWIQTFGCQLNENDSDKIYRVLGRLDYSATRDPAEADLIVLNTCSIREKAEQKVFSLLGRLKVHKQQRPQTLIAVAGCMAQLLGESIRRRAPYVDLVFGTYTIHKLPEMLREIENSRDSAGSGVVAAAELNQADFDFLPLQPEDLLHPGRSRNLVVENVTVQNGCNKNCSYCIVPKVRGREISRDRQEILAEIRLLVSRGVREVTLLGQTVNSYGRKTEYDFADLLEDVNAIKGLQRIRFTTSHPRDLNEKLMLAMANCDKVCEHLHLPLQSGSDTVLKKMYRGHTFNDYLQKIRRLRELVPGISVSTDIIVAFPNESDQDFAETLEALRRVRFDSIFSFIYSPRPYTRAATWSGQIANTVAKQRLYQLQELQAAITRDYLHKDLNKIVEVLVETSNKSPAGLPTIKHGRCLTGRTRNNRIVHFDGCESLIGSLVNLRIDRVLAHSMQGQPVNQEGHKRRQYVH